MASLPPRFLLAMSASLALTGSFVGVSWSLTYIALPALLVSAPKPSAPNAKPISSLQPLTTSDHLSRQYQRIFDVGAAVGPVVGGLSAASFIYASRLLPASATVPKSLIIAAAVLNVAVAPFTKTIMARSNNELQRRSMEASAGKDESLGRKDAKAGTVESYNTPELIEWWGVLNAMRGWLQVGAFACATTAMVI